MQQCFYNKQQKELIRCLHAAYFSPTKSTWINAINNNQFATWPGINAADVNNYLPPSMATTKGHMKMHQKNLRSTKNNSKNQKLIIKNINTNIIDNNLNNDMFPTQVKTKTNDIFVTFYSYNPNDNTVYFDLTGGLPITSAQGNKYIMVWYHYDTNSIVGHPVKSRSNTDVLETLDYLYKYYETCGYPSYISIIDNEASTEIRRSITRKNGTYQLAKPHNHRTLVAEQAIQTYKDHFIAGLCSTDTKFPLNQRESLIAQANLTLNLLQMSQINNSLSAYAQLHGMYDYNKTPIAPPGTRAIIFEPRGIQGT